MLEDLRFWASIVIVGVLCLFLGGCMGGCGKVPSAKVEELKSQLTVATATLVELKKGNPASSPLPPIEEGEKALFKQKLLWAEEELKLTKDHHVKVLEIKEKERERDVAFEKRLRQEAEAERDAVLANSKKLVDALEALKNEPKKKGD